jgi:hypothetical protein
VVRVLAYLPAVVAVVAELVEVRVAQAQLDSMARLVVVTPRVARVVVAA